LPPSVFLIIIEHNFHLKDLHTVLCFSKTVSKSFKWKLHSQNQYVNSHRYRAKKMTGLNKQNGHQKADSPQFNYRKITNCSFGSCNFHIWLTCCIDYKYKLLIWEIGILPRLLLELSNETT
jgi:hypothetical protein